MYAGENDGRAARGSAAALPSCGPVHRPRFILLGIVVGIGTRLAFIRVHLASWSGVGVGVCVSLGVVFGCGVCASGCGCGELE
jgi:hypothetical protein